GELLDLGGQLAASVASVDDAAWLEEEQCGFGVGARAVLRAAGHDEDLPWCQHDVAIAHLDGELSAEYQEELVGVGVLVPGELPLDLHDPDVVVVDLGDFLGQPVLSEARQHRLEVHRFHVFILPRSKVQAAQSSTGARDRAKEEGGSSRSVLLRRLVATGEAHWAVAPIRRERRVVIWGGGRRRRAWGVSPSPLALAVARTTAASRAWQAPWPRLGVMAWAASPASTTAPEV